MPKYAITHLSYFPVRKEADHKSENTTQLIFGELFEIIESSGNWHYIKQHFDSYVGWIDTPELNTITEENAHQIMKQQPVYAGGFFQQIGNEFSQQTIGFGSLLPFWDGISFKIAEEEFFIKGEVIQANPSYPNEFLLERAELLRGIPYLWGGKSTFGIDCSGFVQSIFKLADVKLPRDAIQQKEIGFDVKTDEAACGDLAFFVNEEGRTSHVGILIDKQHIIHASGKVRIDKLDERGIFNAERAIYTHQLEVIRRVR
ncbi:MAG: C40 family peptidase [Bacteroidetes bacterium]|nr:C40 family peptidase [Bacteroidota bacterium]